MEKIKKFNKKYLAFGFLLILLTVSVYAISAGAFATLDLNDVDRNISKIGIVKTIGINNQTAYSYDITFDSIIGENETYTIVTRSSSYSIDVSKYKDCVGSYNRTVCKTRLIQNIREYHLHKLENDMNRIKILQNEAIASLTEQDIEDDMNSLDISLS